MKILYSLLNVAILINCILSFRDFFTFKDRDDSILFSSYASKYYSKNNLGVNSYLSKLEIEKVAYDLILEGEIIEDENFDKTMKDLITYLFKDAGDKMKIIDIEKYYTPKKVNEGLSVVIKPYDNDL